MPTPLAPQTPDADTFGGTFTDADGVVDPETELSATYFNRLVAQTVMTGHTAVRAWARVTVSDGVATLADHDAVWGNTAGVAPTATRTGTGVYTVEWAATHDDLQATPEEQTVSLRCAHASAFKASASRIVNARMADAVTAEVTTYDDAGSAADVDQFTVTVW